MFHQAIVRRIRGYPLAAARGSLPQSRLKVEFPTLIRITTPEVGRAIGLLWGVNDLGLSVHEVDSAAHLVQLGNIDFTGVVQFAHGRSSVLPLAEDSSDRHGNWDIPI
jgi:hypothetical protein